MILPTMKFSDLTSYLFSKNGQYIRGKDPSVIRMSMRDFWNVFQPEFVEYNRFFVVTQRFEIVLYAHPNYNFSTDSRNVGYNVSDSQNPILGNPPTKIIKCVPVGARSAVIERFRNTPISGEPLPGMLGRLAIPRPVLTGYEAPMLYVTETGKFDVMCNYEYYYQDIFDTNKVLTDVIISGIDPTPIFYKMCSGVFLEMLGRLRRSFNYSEFPITTDADQLVKEGMDMYKEAKEELGKRQPWYKAVKQ